MAEAQKPDSAKTSTKGTWSRVRDWDAYGRTLDRIIARERRRKRRAERAARSPDSR